jgi:hypothetical protein
MRHTVGVVALMQRRSNPSTGPLSVQKELAPECEHPVESERTRRRQHRLNEVEIAELVIGRLAGEELSCLAKRFGVHRKTVISHLKRQGVPGRRRSGRVLSAEELEEAGRLYESGVRLELVGQQFGVDRRYLRRVLPEAGFQIRRGGQQKRSH